MARTVDKNLVVGPASPGLTEHEPHQFSADASDLGLPVGEFPTTLRTTLGNSLPLMQQHVERDREGDVSWVDYAQVLGVVRLRVYND